MFGRLMEVAKSSMEFENKSEILLLAQTINRGRIELVHGLTKQENMNEISLKAQRVRADFDEFSAMFVETQDWFHLCFKDLRKDKEWDDLLSDE